jgi:arabinogalactan endo-1,4-beta-galactosidase
MYKYFVFVVLLIAACSKPEPDDPDPVVVDFSLIRGADLSALPKILETSNAAYFDADGNYEKLITTFKKNGGNTVRLKLWHTPEEGYSGFEDVKTFAEEIKAEGLKVWLTVHYSDTWADPGHQITPAAWQGLTFEEVQDSMYNYTARIINEIHPDFIQIGNETNPGILFPHGKISSNQAQFMSLMATGLQAVRDNDPEAKTIIHFAGTSGSTWYFDIVGDLDFDIIGLSYYPFYHGKDLALLSQTLDNLAQVHNKDVIIAETAYPFTLDWNDWTNNIVGSEDALILPDYPATPQGQKDFINKIKQITKDADRTLGFCYWGAELIAFDGAESQNGSPWENLALYGFNNYALPVMGAFAKD